jgi:rare lipoprotein A
VPVLPEDPRRTGPATDRVEIARRSLRWIAHGLLAIFIVLLVTGCHHHVQQAYQPPPPPLYRSHAGSVGSAGSITRNYPARPEGKPDFVETGMASWYGTGRRAADGSSFDKNAMTAAHKTLPLGTLVRVTNLANNESIIVRITDRGPFVNGRVLDLSEGAAKQIDLYRMGVAKVRIEAFPNPGANPIGKWVVQTGAFQTEQDASGATSAPASPSSPVPPATGSASTHPTTTAPRPRPSSTGSANPTPPPRPTSSASTRPSTTTRSACIGRNTYRYRNKPSVLGSFP